MTDIDSEIRKHAIEAYPEECVGYVSNGQYYRLKNVANTPRERYRLHPDDKLKLFKLGNDLEALVHSHPRLDNRPSREDINAQKFSGIVFWIIGTDGTNTTDIREVDL